MWYLQVNLTEILLIQASFRLVEVYYKNLSNKGYDKRKEKNLGKIAETSSASFPSSYLIAFYI